jgi:hypothetical protein
MELEIFTELNISAAKSGLLYVPSNTASRIAFVPVLHCDMFWPISWLS